MPDFPDLVADHIVEYPAACLKCGHCQRVVTKATAVIRRFPGIDVVSCHDCQFERTTAALFVVCGEVNEARSEHAVAQARHIYHQSSASTPL